MRITHDSSLTHGSASKGTLQRGIELAQTAVIRWGAGTRHERVAPAAGAATTVFAAQILAAGVDATINGTLASGGVATLDVPRGLSIVSANAGDTTQVVTVRGTDEYGESMTETRTMNGTTPVLFIKAFKKVLRVTSATLSAGNVTLGTSNALGLPYRFRAGDVIVTNLDGAAEVGTRTVADTATPTAATGDIRGTFTPGTAPNGTREYTFVHYVRDNGQDAVGGDLGQFKA